MRPAPEFVYRHRWSVGDIVLWDNRCTCHVALPDFDQSQPRHMLRCSMQGEAMGRLAEAGAGRHEGTDDPDRGIAVVNRRALLGAALALPAAIRRAAAQGWAPAQPIRMVVPYPPGGTTDVLGRLVAEGMAERLGKQVVVDNRSGASGIIGTEYVQKSAPDGQTLVFVSASPWRAEGALPEPAL